MFHTRQRERRKNKLKSELRVDIIRRPIKGRLSCGK